MKDVSEDVDDLFDNACSVADVSGLIAEGLMYAQCQKTKTLTKEPMTMSAIQILKVMRTL